MNKIQISIALLATMVCGNACAYLDPGSGGLLLQVLPGGVAALGVVTKVYWHRFKRDRGFGAKKQADE